MKKKRDQSGQRSADYVVGQVSSSLFQKNSAASGSSLSALFGVVAAAPAGPVLFQPASETVQASSDVKTQEAAEVRGQPGLNRKRKKMQLTNQSEAERRLESREIGLQIADEDEQRREVPVMSKKKKKSEVMDCGGEEKGVEHWVMKRQRMRTRKEEEGQKKKRTVFVGNLPISCTKKTLQNLFRDKGAIESIRFRSVVREDPSMSRKVAVIKRKLHPKKQSINAYVVFKEEGGVAEALQRNGMEIEKDFVIRVDRVGDNSSHDHKRSVFVGNLSYEINELAFRQYFEDCGSIEAVRLVRDKNSGLGKGFGYVLFQSADSVQLALKLDGSKLEGRSIRVKRSVKKEKEKKTNSKGGTRRATRTPAQGLTKDPGPDRGRHLRGVKPPKNFCGKQQASARSSTSFTGEMVGPNKKKKKLAKKKVRPNKTVHI